MWRHFKKKSVVNPEVIRRRYVGFRWVSPCFSCCGSCCADSLFIPFTDFPHVWSPVFHIIFPCASGSPHLPAHFQLSTFLPSSPRLLNSQYEYTTFLLHHYLRLCLHLDSHCDKNTQQQQCVGLCRLSVQIQKRPTTFLMQLVTVVFFSKCYTNSRIWHICWI